MVSAVYNCYENRNRVILWQQYCMFLLIGQTRPWFGVALLVDSFYLLSYPIVYKIHMEIHMCSCFL